MPDEVKTPRPKMTGISLETDVLKKISHQLARVEDPDTMDRIVKYVHAAVQEQKLALVTKMRANGQLPMPQAPTTPAWPGGAKGEGELW